MNTNNSAEFIRGVAYAAALLKQYTLNAEQLLKEAGISEQDLLRYADEYDLAILGLVKK